LLILAGKGCKTHQATLLLAELGYGQDAGILLRSLFNLVVNLTWISKVPTTRVKMYVDYDWILRDKAGNRISYGMEHLGLESSLTDAQLADLKREISEEVARTIEEHDYGRSGWSKRNLFEMAEEVGLKLDYQFIYPILSDVEHSSPRSLIYYEKVCPQGVMVDLNMTGLPIPPILGSAYWCLLQIGRLVDRFLPVHIKNDLDAAEAKLPIIKAMALEPEGGQ